MKRIIFLVVALVLIGASCNRTSVQQTAPQYADGTIHLAGRSISFELAQSPEAQTKGLSGRESIEENQGMLFQMNVPSFYTFWMKDMKFGIDMIWLKDAEIVDISHNVPFEPGVANDQLKTYTSKKPANFILELKAGWAERNNLKIGDKIEVLQVIRP